MILEAADLIVKPGETTAFEVAFKQASSIIASMKGYIQHELHHSLEDSNKYLLPVPPKDHTEGFHDSEQYQAWKRYSITHTSRSRLLNTL